MHKIWCQYSITKRWGPLYVTYVIIFAYNKFINITVVTVTVSYGMGCCSQGSYCRVHIHLGKSRNVCNFKLYMQVHNLKMYGIFMSQQLKCGVWSTRKVWKRKMHKSRSFSILENPWEGMNISPTLSIFIPQTIMKWIL